jgi:hypothetical protein
MSLPEQPPPEKEEDSVTVDTSDGSLPGGEEEEDEADEAEEEELVVLNGPMRVLNEAIRRMRESEAQVEALPRRLPVQASEQDRVVWLSEHLDVFQRHTANLHAVGSAVQAVFGVAQEEFDFHLADIAQMYAVGDEDDGDTPPAPPPPPMQFGD